MWRSGFLQFAVHDEAVNGFGRNDGSLVGLEKTKAAGGRFTSHPSQSARRMGHPGVFGWVECGKAGAGGAGGLHPTEGMTALFHADEGSPNVSSRD
jgi:hypothetical protein